MESDSEEDEYIDDLPMPAARSKAPRWSVSAEAFGNWNKKKEFNAVKVKKTSKQKNKIIEKLEKSFMFASLDSKERDIIVDAVKKRRVKKGEVVI